MKIFTEKLSWKAESKIKAISYENIKYKPEPFVVPKKKPKKKNSDEQHNSLQFDYVKHKAEEEMERARVRSQVAKHLLTKQNKKLFA